METELMKLYGIRNASENETYKGVRIKYTPSVVYTEPSKSDSKKEITVFVEAEGAGIPAISFHITAPSVSAAKSDAHREIDNKLRFYNR